MTRISRRDKLVRTGSNILFPGDGGNCRMADIASDAVTCRFQPSNQLPIDVGTKIDVTAEELDHMDHIRLSFDLEHETMLADPSDELR